MERLGKRPLVLTACLFGAAMCAAPNKLTLVEQHLNTNAKSRDLELGTLIFYFDSKPQIAETHQKNQVVYTFANTQSVGSEVQGMINRIKLQKPLNYSVRIETPKKDTLQLIISFDTSKVGVSYSHFPSIKMQQGVIFHIYDKELLSKINDASHKEILSVACVKIPRVVIDCGHGGADAGAIGFGRATEKDITLAVGLEVADLLKKNSIHVLLTRDCDSTISLGDRTTLANTAQADVFVSIHANSAPAKNVSGIETFCIDPIIFKKSTSFALSSAELAAANGFFLSKCNRSEQLAHSIHAQLINYLRQKRFSVVDRTVKHAASQVLLGAHMPAVLIEIGFVTHPRESRMLMQPNYQHAVASGISNGILEYFFENKA